MFLVFEKASVIYLYVLAAQEKLEKVQRP